MFESIRKHSKIAMLVMFLLIIPSFVLVGIDSNYFSGSSPTVARVDGSDITQAEWDDAHRLESDRIRAQQPNVEGALLDSPQARYATLERLVRNRVLERAAIKQHLQPSDSRLARELQEIPQIAALRRPDGTLDAEAYRQLAASQGLTPEGFESRVRQQLAVNQVIGPVMSTSFVTLAQARATLDPLFQEREIRVTSFLPKDFVSKVGTSEQELRGYYQEHVDQFKLPEQADVEFVVLNLDAVRSGITVTEDDLKKYYEQNLAQYASKEERRVSHILIASSKDDSAQTREAARAKALSLLDQVRKAPNTFATLARASSEDPGSAAQGGDLGFIARGAMVKPFEDAAFALDDGAFSDIVETDFGFHILHVLQVKKPVVPSFNEKREEIEALLSDQMAQKRFAEVAEMFTNMVYEQSDSLEPVAKKLNLKLRTALNITRNASDVNESVLKFPKLLDAIFSPDSLKEKRNTEAMEVGPSELVSARVIKYAPARTQSFEESGEDVRKKFVAEKSAQLAREEGAGQLKARTSGVKGLAVGQGSSTVVSRQNLQSQDPRLVERVMTVTASELPTWIGVDLGALGYRVVEVLKILDSGGSAGAQEQQRLKQYEDYWATAEAYSYYEVLKQRFNVQFKVPRPV